MGVSYNMEYLGGNFDKMIVILFENFCMRVVFYF